MGAASRRKGAAGERELIALLRERLGDLPELRRNLDQPRDGGADLRIAGHAIEVKRAEQFRSSWIDQADAQAGGDVPVVAWRRNGGRWRLLLVMDLDGFAAAVRRNPTTPEAPAIEFHRGSPYNATGDTPA